MAHKTAVEAWYDEHAELEEQRLDEGRLEFEVTMRVINSCVSNVQPEGANIVDVGGGPGRYAIALSKLGHQVTLNDLSSQSLEIVKKNAQKQSVDLQEMIHADARELLSNTTLGQAAGTFDLVLCLGPLYHLICKQDRTKVLENCLQLVKPGGHVIVAYVSVYAHLRDMARRDPGRLAREWAFYSSYLSTGQYTRNPQTESFHVYPLTLEEELVCLEGKAEVDRVVSCEGFLGFEGAKELKALSQEEMGKWVDIVMRSAEERETLNSADHVLVVLRRVK